MQARGYGFSDLVDSVVDTLGVALSAFLRRQISAELGLLPASGQTLGIQMGNSYSPGGPMRMFFVYLDLYMTPI